MRCQLIGGQTLVINGEIVDNPFHQSFPMLRVSGFLVSNEKVVKIKIRGQLRKKGRWIKHLSTLADDCFRYIQDYLILNPRLDYQPNYFGDTYPIDSYVYKLLPRLVSQFLAEPKKKLELKEVSVDDDNQYIVLPSVSSGSARYLLSSYQEEFEWLYKLVNQCYPHQYLRNKGVNPLTVFSVFLDSQNEVQKGSFSSNQVEEWEDELRLDPLMLEKWLINIRASRDRDEMESLISGLLEPVREGHFKKGDIRLSQCVSFYQERRN